MQNNRSEQADVSGTRLYPRPKRTRFYARLDNYEKNKRLHESDQDELMFLSALEEAGVDNWSGYEIAQEIYKGMKNDS